MVAVVLMFSLLPSTACGSRALSVPPRTGAWGYTQPCIVVPPKTLLQANSAMGSAEWVVTLLVCEMLWLVVGVRDEQDKYQPTLSQSQL